jgi:hypothetical protein
VRIMGVRELRETIWSLPSPLLALEPLHFTVGERRAKKYQIPLSSDSSGALLANLYNCDDHK